MKSPNTKKRSAILVTGMHRSGTTWVGRVLNTAPGTYYLGELLRPDTDLIDKKLVQHWYPYIAVDNSQQLSAYLDRILALNFRWPERLGWRQHVPSRLRLYSHTRRWFGLPRPIMKDPFAAFSLEWLQQLFHMTIVCMVRHPAGVVSSLRRANWRFDFKNFLQQPRLMEEWLYPFAKRIENPPDDIVEEGALLWLCVNHVLFSSVRSHPEWGFWRYEDITQDPLNVFNTIFSHVGLAFTLSVERRILDYSRDSNPVQAPGNELHVIRRNSRAVPDLWRSQLSAPELSRIRKVVEPVSCLYYADEDW